MFLKSLVREGLDEGGKRVIEDELTVVTTTLQVQGKEYKREDLPMDILMDLSLDELRELDAKFAQCEISTKS